MTVVPFDPIADFHMIELRGATVAQLSIEILAKANASRGLGNRRRRRPRGAHA